MVAITKISNKLAKNVDWGAGGSRQLKEDIER